LEIDHIPDFFNIGEACTNHTATQETNPRSADFDASQTAIIVENESTGVSSISYQQLNLKSNRFAHSINELVAGALNPQSSGKLKIDHAVDQPQPVKPAKSSGADIIANPGAPAHRVLLWLPNCLEFPIAFFGCLKQGAIAVPVSTMLSGNEILYMLDDCAATVLVTTSMLLERLDTAKTSNLRSIILTDADTSAAAGIANDIAIRSFVDFLRDGSDQGFPVNTRAEDPAYLVYTSGTTGFPKGVLHAHRALLGRMPASSYWFNYKATGNDRILHSGKFNWTYVLGTALMDPLLLGKSVVVYEGAANPACWVELIAKHQCTIFIGVPTLYRQIIQKTRFDSSHVPSLRHCMCAGEHLSDEVLSGWRNRFKLDIFEAIGMSECSYYLSQHAGKPVKPGSAGFPQPGHKVALLNEHLQPVNDNEEGMLCIGLDDPGLFIGYWNLPEETDKSREQGYFLTGDYAKRDTEGYFWFLGRKDDIINSFGYRVSPMEIERVIKMHKDVADCVALEEPVGKDKNIVAICVMLEASAKAESAIAMESMLIEFAESHLAAYKVPKAIHFMDSFPRTANGKVIRNNLKMLVSS